MSAPRRGNEVGTNWAEISSPVYMDSGSDLMLLHPGGAEELLVAGRKGAVADPSVSLDGRWIYFTLFHDLEKATITESSAAGADIYKINVKTREIVRLTRQEFTPNTGAARWSKDYRTSEPGKNWIEYGVFNTGPSPLPGGRLAFTSNRNGFRPPKPLAAHATAFRDGRRRRQRRVHRAYEPGECASSHGSEGWPNRLQHARIARSANVNFVGALEHPSRWHQLGAGDQCVSTR